MRNFGPSSFPPPRTELPGVHRFYLQRPAPVLGYDLTNGKRYVADITNPVILKFAVQPSAVARKFVLREQSATNYQSISSSPSAELRQLCLAGQPGNYLRFQTGTDCRRQWFQSSQRISRLPHFGNRGGYCNAKVYMIDELVDQFDFGIKNTAVHP